MDNLIGKRFGKLIVLKFIDTDKYGHKEWLCNCDCGKQIIVRADSLKSKNTQSCGCLKFGNSLKHGYTGSPTYLVWCAMIQRCNNSKNRAYKDYGGRGITVCKRWLKFENFLEDVGEISEGLTLDRIDNNDNYCKENCRQATRKEQARNTTRNINITFNGKTQCLIDHCNELNLKYSTIFSRISRGWLPEKALKIPIRRK
jgi:hypothetical protein